MSKIVKTVKLVTERFFSVIIGLLSGYLYLWITAWSFDFVDPFYPWKPLDPIYRIVELIPVMLTAIIVAIFLSRKLFVAFYSGFFMGYIYSFIFDWYESGELFAEFFPDLASQWEGLKQVAIGCLAQAPKVLVGFYLSSSITCVLANRGRFAISGLFEAMIASIAFVYSIWNRGLSFEKRLLVFLLLTFLCAWTEWHYRRNRCV